MKIHDLVRLVVSFALIVASALTVGGCFMPGRFPIYGGGGWYGNGFGYGGWGGSINAQPGGYGGGWGYNPMVFNGGQYWGGGAWGGQQWQPGYYQAGAPFFQGGMGGGTVGPGQVMGFNGMPMNAPQSVVTLPGGYTVPSYAPR